MLALDLLLVQVLNLGAELPLQVLQHGDEVGRLRLVRGRRHVGEEREVGLLLQQGRRHLPRPLIVLALQRAQGLGDGLDGLGEVLVHRQVGLLLGLARHGGGLHVRGDRGYLAVVDLDLRREALRLRFGLLEPRVHQRVLLLRLGEALLLLRRDVDAELLEARVLHLLLVLLLLRLRHHALEQLHDLLHGGDPLPGFQGGAEVRERTDGEAAQECRRRLHCV
mmetsp:Transcript_39903/g.113027  ORF Transcript_39903/g.113027 Transcript_39903/m.113027 type:complete len:222 (+) Transcript_39903:1321-1986(+)